MSQTQFSYSIDLNELPINIACHKTTWNFGKSTTRLCRFSQCIKSVMTISSGAFIVTVITALCILLISRLMKDWLHWRELDNGKVTKIKKEVESRHATPDKGDFIFSPPETKSWILVQRNIANKFVWSMLAHICLANNWIKQVLIAGQINRRDNGRSNCISNLGDFRKMNSSTVACFSQ